MSPSHVRLVWGLHWVAMFVAMHIPKNRLPSIDVFRFDKEIHFICYGVLAMLCAWSAVRGGILLSGRWYAKWLVVFAAYGVLDELLQALPMVNRTADVADWAADMVGVIVGFGVVVLVRRSSRE